MQWTWIGYWKKLNLSKSTSESVALKLLGCDWDLTNACFLLLVFSLSYQAVILLDAYTAPSSVVIQMCCGQKSSALVVWTYRVHSSLIDIFKQSLLKPLFSDQSNVSPLLMSFPVVRHRVPSGFSTSTLIPPPPQFKDDHEVIMIFLMPVIRTAKTCE